jgi:cytochrome c biogenesis protein CcdA
MQALIEWLDGLLFEWNWPVARLFNRWLNKPIQTGVAGADAKSRTKRKKGIIHTITLVLGILISLVADIEVLSSFAGLKDVGVLDNVVAGLVISMGTDGFNQLIKLVESAKANQAKSAQQSQ